MRQRRLRARLAAPTRPANRGGTGSSGDGTAADSSETGSPAGTAAGTGAGQPGALPARINLTIPLATLLGLADHPGEASGFGPVDAALARDMASRAAGHPSTSWCLTVTDPDGHPLAHGCARPGRRRKPGPGTGRGKRAPPGSSPAMGPPGDYGTWRLPSGLLGPETGQPGADLRPGPDRGHRLRPPVPDQRPRSRRPAPPSGRDPRRRMHLAALPARRPPLRLRARHPLGTRR